MPHPINPNIRPHCYICAEARDLTSDHIPPKGFFPPDKRQDLLSVDCCERCHSPLSLDDEVMRLWLSSAANVSESGKWILVNRALPSLEKKPLLKTEVAKFVTSNAKTSPDGVAYQENILGMPVSRAHPFIRRITKGLLYTLYPGYDYFSDHFSVWFRPLNMATVPDINKMIASLVHLSKGYDVFRTSHGITKDAQDGGLWVHVFYNAVAFVCIHSKDRTYAQDFGAQYKEWEGLPPLL
jgi:hypothetical protein